MSHFVICILTSPTLEVTTSFLSVFQRQFLGVRNSTVNTSSLQRDTHLLHTHSHVFYGDVFENLAVVDVPHGLVVPDLRRQQDGAQHDASPVAGHDLDLGVHQQTLQVHLYSRRGVHTHSRHTVKHIEAPHVCICNCIINY